MKRKLKRLTALLGSAVMVFSLMACGSNEGSSAGEASSPETVSSEFEVDKQNAEEESVEEGSVEVKSVNVTIPAVYDLPDAGLVEDEINKITEPKYGIHMDLEFITLGNWTQQSNLLFTGDEADIIAIFSTPLSTFVKNGQLTDLTDYYANASEEFRAVWGDEQIKGTTVGGRIMAIPNLRNIGAYIGLNIDEEIAAEYGIKQGQTLTMEEIDTFLRAVHEEYPDRYALVPQSGGSLIGEWSWDGLGDAEYIGVLPECGQVTEVQNLFDTEDFRTFCGWTRSWYEDGLIMQDILSNTLPFQTLIGNKQGIACFDNYGIATVDGIIRTVVVDKWTQSNAYQAICYGINQNSRDKDAAWKTMEILYTDPDVCVLLNNGIEGMHYVKNDDGTISFPEGKTAADCGYGLSQAYWITPYSAYAYPLDVNGADMFERLIVFNEETLKSKAFGFSFDTTDVIDQYTACSNVMDKYYAALMSGSVDVESTIEQANKEFEAAGLNDIIAAKQEQLDEFFAK